jgi:RecA-family ATPase
VTQIYGNSYMTLSQLTQANPEKASPVSPIPWAEVGEPITAPIKPGPPDLIPGLVPKNGQLVIAGETNIGKSLVALEIVSSLITGKQLWGELEPTEKLGKILYILGEHYNDVIKRLWQITDLPMTDDVRLVGPDDLGTKKWLVQNGKQNIEAIEHLTNLAKGVDLVVFDPLAAFFVGTDTENDNPGMRVVLDTMSTITQTSGASCIILAHQGKPSMGKNGEEFTRTKYAIRGASSVEDAATNIFYMGHLTGGSGAATGADASRLFSIRKRKYKGDAPDEYKLLRDRDKLTHTILGNRPFIEARRAEVQQKYARLVTGHPEMTPKAAYKILALTENCHENTIRNYLGAT